MSQMRRDRPTTSGDKELVVLKALGAAIAASFLPVFAYNLAAGHETVWHPLGLIIDLGKGNRAWPESATTVLIAEIVILAALLASGLWLLKKSGRLQKIQEHSAERRIDKYADSMTDPRDVEQTDPKALADETRRIAPAISETHPGHGGIVMGTTVKWNREVRMTWEWVCIAIAGSRMGKSATLAIPAMCYAPGFALGTSNKDDIYTHTLYLRKQMGRVWLFDLEGVTTGNRRERANFWFNPLRRVDDLPSARVVCDYFISAGTDSDARADAYFDGAARDLFGSYLLAAALAGGDLRHVVDWLRETQSQIPVKVLAENGYADLANTMQSKQSVNAKQRDGFYDMARRHLAPLDEPRYEEAILPNTRITIGTDNEGRILITEGREVHDLPELDIDQVVRSTDTVYAMSKKGAGSASALTTALVGAIGDALQEYGAHQIGGRVPIPAVLVLDEAANICKLQQLPEWYSHFGSRGINLITILQSPSQAKKVWGETNYDAMVDASNMVWYGGNVDDGKFLASLSDAIGDHHVKTENRSRTGGILGGGQTTISTSWQKEKILTVDDLKALPRTRAIVTMGGSKPLLVRKHFWGNTPFATDIKRSVAESKAHTERAAQKALPLGFSDRETAEEVTGPIPRIVDAAAKEPIELPVQRIDDNPTVAVAAAPDRGIDDIFESEFFGEGKH
jgi:type IV secretory pathway TraG/TraD family ATPase VirD4